MTIQSHTAPLTIGNPRHNWWFKALLAIELLTIDNPTVALKLANSKESYSATLRSPKKIEIRINLNLSRSLQQPSYGKPYLWLKARYRKCNQDRNVFPSWKTRGAVGWSFPVMWECKLIISTHSTERRKKLRNPTKLPHTTGLAGNCQPRQLPLPRFVVIVIDVK